MTRQSIISRLLAISVVCLSLNLIGYTFAAATPQIPASVTSLRKRVQRDWDLMEQIRCFRDGSAFQGCNTGPWYFPDEWKTAGDSLRELKYGYPCSTDRVYLTKKQYDFWGFGAKNITGMLTKVGIRTAFFAAQTCLHDKPCNTAYKGKAQAMYNDFYNYANKTFMTPLTNYLKKYPQYQFCAVQQYSTPLKFVSDTPTLDNEYIGIHNPAFIPGLYNFTADNGIAQQFRTEAAPINDLSIAGLERVFHYMVQGATVPASPAAAKAEKKIVGSQISKELFPGCSRYDWVYNKCKGVTPPRSWDLNGRVMPMSDRLKEADSLRKRETELSRSTGTALAIRKVQSRDTCPQSSYLDQNIDAIKLGKTLFTAATTSLNLYGLVLGPEAAADFLALALGTIAGPEIVAGAVLLGSAWFILSACVDMQETWGDENFIPQEVINGVKAVNLAKSYADIAGMAQEGNVVNAYIGSAQKLLGGGSPQAGYNLAQSYQEKAKQCCAINCGGAICQQAALQCAAIWGNVTIPDSCFD